MLTVEPVEDALEGWKTELNDLLSIYLRPSPLGTAEARSTKMAQYFNTQVFATPDFNTSGFRLQRAGGVSFEVSREKCQVSLTSCDHFVDRQEHLKSYNYELWTSLPSSILHFNVSFLPALSA